MSVSDNYSPDKSVGDGATTIFTGNWQVFNDDYFKVYLEVIATGVQTLQTIGTDYTLVHDADGYTVTMIVAPPATDNLIRSRIIAQEQIVPYKTSKGFQGDIIETSYDVAVSIDQDQQDEIDRALKFPLAATITDPTLPIPLDGYGVIWDGTTGKQKNTTESLAILEANLTIVADDIDNVNLVGADIANVNLVGADIANVNLVAADIANVNIVATNIADVIICADDIAAIIAAPTEAANAATSATASAASAANLSGTSVTSITIGTGSKVFETQTGKSFDVGRWILIVSDADETNYVAGQVNSYSGTTLDLEVATISGSGTFTDWTIYISGASIAASALEIKTAYESNANTNEYDDAEQTKLAGIETSATADQTDAEIKTAYEANADTNEFSDAEQTKLAGIETAATIDQTGAEIKTAYQAEANAFTDTKNTKLTGIETAATADQTDAEIKTAYENNADTNAFNDADETKLDFITVTQAVDLDDIETKVNNLDAAVVLKGNWDASAGTFPGGGTAQAGFAYIVSVGGTVDSVTFAINDRIIAILDNASTSTFAANWFKADYTDQVQSVFGRTGAVVAVSGDYDADEITETATGKIMTDTERTKLSGIATAATAQPGITDNSDANAITINADETVDLVKGLALDGAASVASGLSLTGPIITPSGDMVLNPAASLNIILTPSDADAFDANDGTTSYYVINTLLGTSGVHAHSWDTSNPSITNSASANFTLGRFIGYSLAFTGNGGADITGDFPTQLHLERTTISSDVASTNLTGIVSTQRIRAPAAGTNVILDNVTGLHIEDGGGQAGTETVQHGIFIDTLTVATTNYGITIGSSDADQNLIHVGVTGNPVMSWDESANAFAFNKDVTAANSIIVGEEILLTERADHIFAPAAGRGILWVRDDEPCSLMFTSDDGADLDISSGAGGGDFLATGAVPMTGIIRHLTVTGITAGTTQTQAGATALTGEFNHITASAVDLDGVKLPTAIKGQRVTVHNDDAAQSIQVWPFLGDKIDGGATDAVDPTVIAFGAFREYYAIDAAEYIILPAAAGGGGGGGFLRRTVFTGDGTWTKGADTTYVNVRSVGGGGGGAGALTGGESSGGSGAGYCEEFIDVTGTSSETITIGAAGAGQTGNGNGGAGGDTTFGAFHTAGGGLGGLNGTLPAGVAGGAATGGDLNIPGQASRDTRNAEGSSGGDSVLGHGGPGPQVNNATGDAPVGFGGGGPGGAGSGDGLAGTIGIMIVDEYQVA